MAVVVARTAQRAKRRGVGDFQFDSQMVSVQFLPAQIVPGGATLAAQTHPDRICCALDAPLRARRVPPKQDGRVMHSKASRVAIGAGVAVRF